jgi:hypothetical protein
LNGADNFQSFLLNTTTLLGFAGTDNQWVFEIGDYNSDGWLDLYGILKANTGSGRTEVHILNGANNFQSFLLQTATALGPTGTDSQWVFDLGDYNGDGKLDLYGILKANSGSGRTEVYILNGANIFQSFLLQTATVLGPTGTDSQWVFSTPPPARFFQVVARHSGKCLDVNGGPGATGNGVKVQQWDCLGAGQTNQLWRLVPVGNAVQVVAVHSNKCLDVNDGAMGNGVKVQQWGCSGGTNQLWRLVPVGSAFQVVAVHSNKCLDVEGGTSARSNGARLHQWDCLGTANQHWRLVPVN